MKSASTFPKVLVDFRSRFDTCQVTTMLLLFSLNGTNQTLQQLVHIATLCADVILEKLADIDIVFFFDKDTHFVHPDYNGLVF